MFAMTWSAPRAVKAMVGNQIEIILHTISRDEVDRKTAIVTSQLAKVARREIWCRAGVAAVQVGKWPLIWITSTANTQTQNPVAR